MSRKERGKKRNEISEWNFGHLQSCCHWTLTPFTYKNHTYTYSLDCTVPLDSQRFSSNRYFFCCTSCLILWLFCLIFNRPFLFVICIFWHFSSWENMTKPSKSFKLLSSVYSCTNVCAWVFKFFHIQRTFSWKIWLNVK